MAIAILNNEIVDFSLIDVLFGKFDIDELRHYSNKSHSFACKILYL